MARGSSAHRCGVCAGVGGAVVLAGLISVLAWKLNRSDETPDGVPAGVGAQAAPTAIAPVEPPELTLYVLRNDVVHTLERGRGHGVLALGSGDRLQLRVRFTGERYVYVYWYDAEGRAKRLWPAVPGDAAASSPLVLPPTPGGSTRAMWYPVERRPGIECALAAVGPRPLSKEQVEQLDRARLVLGG